MTITTLAGEWSALTTIATTELREMLAQCNAASIRAGSFSARWRAALVRELARREAAP